ncbi:hypothetical protein FH972_025932 [Carpinus fangiana]|uniref:Uncharacterized protein n=1 Tax=Carpinus fangiana TaxID=176857 RepID=A0A5N6L2P7_9ROSI|nr:hypothetical protein FH972_025932 [Carpinus fangiana]
MLDRAISTLLNATLIVWGFRRVVGWVAEAKGKVLVVLPIFFVSKKLWCTITISNTTHTFVLTAVASFSDLPYLSDDYETHPSSETTAPVEDRVAFDISASPTPGRDQCVHGHHWLVSVGLSSHSTQHAACARRGANLREPPHQVNSQRGKPSTIRSSRAKAAFSNSTHVCIIFYMVKTFHSGTSTAPTHVLSKAYGIFSYSRVQNDVICQGRSFFRAAKFDQCLTFLTFPEICLTERCPGQPIVTCVGQAAMEHRRFGLLCAPKYPDCKAGVHEKCRQDWTIGSRPQSTTPSQYAWLQLHLAQRREATNVTNRVVRAEAVKISSPNLARDNSSKVSQALAYSQDKPAIFVQTITRHIAPLCVCDLPQRGQHSKVSGSEIAFGCGCSSSRHGRANGRCVPPSRSKNETLKAVECKTHDEAATLKVRTCPVGKIKPFRRGSGHGARLHVPFGVSVEPDDRHQTPALRHLATRPSEMCYV